MKQTAIDKLIEYFIKEEKQGCLHWCIHDLIAQLYVSKEMEKNNTDNKVIHFAEWLTNKHTTTLITLYEHFEEQYYNETFKSE